MSSLPVKEKTSTTSNSSKDFSSSSSGDEPRGNFQQNLRHLSVHPVGQMGPLDKHTASSGILTQRQPGSHVSCPLFLGPLSPWSSGPFCSEKTALMTKGKPVRGHWEGPSVLPCDVTLRQPRSQVLQHPIAGQLRGPGGSTGWSGVGGGIQTARRQRSSGGMQSGEEMASRGHGSHFAC